MEIPFELVRTVSAVVEAGTFDAAAKMLRITPSAISQRIRTLEHRLGRVLLVRSKPVQPTEAGRTILRLARQLALLEHDTLAEIGLDSASGDTTAIALVVNADSLGTWLLPALVRLAAQHPVTFELHREDEDRTTRLLESGVVMAAVTSRSEPVPGCIVSPLGAIVYRAVATPSFIARWFGSGVDAASLERAPLVDFDRDDELQARFLHSYGVQASTPPRHYVPATHDFATAVRLGLGWAMLPEQQLSGPIEEGQLVDLAPDAPDAVPLYWQQWNLRSAVLDAIAADIAAEARLTLRRAAPATQRNAFLAPP